MHFIFINIYKILFRIINLKITIVSFVTLIGDSVEENANLIVRLLIRRPECLGPALRGEGGGLLKAIIDGLKISLQIAATQNIQNPIVMSALLDADSEIIDFMNEK